MRLLFTLIIALILNQFVWSQYPSYFTYNIENGAPSNEIYCIIQDKDGYVWIGCDAGVFRFNGVRFEQFTSPELTARSATGLVQAISGRIYGYNFNRQIFYIEHGRLTVVKGWDIPVTSMTVDLRGNIWVASNEGVFKVRENDFKIEKLQSEKHLGSGNQYYAGSATTDRDGAFYYHNGNGIFKWKNDVLHTYNLGELDVNIPICVSRSPQKPWVVKMTGDKVFKFVDDNYATYNDPGLLNALKGRKINYLFETEDDKLWFATYTGLICHDLRKKKTDLLFEQFSFSNGLFDTEGNYWFSTLHNGLIRIPSMGVRTWNTLSENNNPDQFSHIQIGRNMVYAGGTTGFITQLDPGTLQIKKILHEPNSDMGVLYLDPKNSSLLMNKMNNLYRYDHGNFSLINPEARPIKSILSVPGGYLVLSSQGLYFVRGITDKMDKEHCIDTEWYRDICFSPFSSNYLAATNNGISVIAANGGKYTVVNKILKGKQIISIASDRSTGNGYFLTFDGALFRIDRSMKPEVVKRLKGDIRANQVRVFKGKIYIATNKGILQIDPTDLREVLFDRYDGLASNNIRSMEFNDLYCWAVGEGIQRIPLSLFKEPATKGRVIEKGLIVNGFLTRILPGMELSYDDKLSFLVDGLCYRSNGNFQFAYRIKGYHDTWIKVPGSVDKIDLAALPTGQLKIELKLIDHNGSDSVNKLTYDLYVIPPFWQRWWFYLLIAGMVGFGAFLIFRKRESDLKKRQFQELRRLKLEHELRLTQQNALKAQMNPHFLFNVLNSIKGYIYENDKKYAARYLSDFSSLVRKVLELSSLPTVSLESELEALRLYIDLEAMLLQSDFVCSIDIDDTVDASGIQVPALLLQPYVENAFKHGLRHKVGEKRLRINATMNEKDELLTVEITDNGIGRKASAELNAQNRGEHQSFATSAMEKRIELLNHERKDVVGVEIRDNFEGNLPTGTTVIIRIHV